MTIDLLVVSYQTKDMLERLVETLHSDYEPGVWKLHIADNGSTDGSKEWPSDAYVDDRYEIDAVYYNGNIGYSAAINQMAAESNSEFLCAVNADTWFTTNHVKQVEQSFRDHQRAGVIGVKQLDEQKRIRHGGIFWYPGGPNPIHRGWAQVDADDVGLHDTTQCWTVSGSIYYVRRTAWDECANYSPFRALFPQDNGAFLPTPHYFEETFCSQLMHHLDWEVWYDGSVETAGHSWHASSPQNGHGGVTDYFVISQKIYIDTCNALGIPHECR